MGDCCFPVWQSPVQSSPLPVTPIVKIGVVLHLRKSTIKEHRNSIALALLHRTCVIKGWNGRAVALGLCGLLAKVLPTGDVRLDGSRYLKIPITASSNCDHIYHSWVCGYCCIVEGQLRPCESCWHHHCEVSCIVRANERSLK